MTSIDPMPQGREPGRRYRFDATDTGESWELGWDTRMGTFFAQRVDLDVDGTVLDVGTRVHQLTAVETLAEHIGQAIPTEITHELYQDALAHPVDSPTNPIRADWAATLYQQLGIAPQWSLRALPVVELIEAHAAEWGDRDARTAGTGLGLNPALVERMLDGSIDELDIDQIAHVCDALRCSPFDMWGTNAARSILHTYGPEHWPRYIEPIAGPDDTEPRRPHRWGLPTGPGETALVTPYRAVGYTTVDGEGIPVDPNHLPPDAEPLRRQMVFAQAAEPRPTSLPLDTIPDDPRSGGAVDPRLAVAASALRLEMEEPFDHSVDLVRFTWHGDDLWLAWNHDANTWQTRPDPRAAYAGPAREIVETNGLTDPQRVLLEAVTPPGRVPPLPVTDHDPPFPHGTDVIVTGYRQTAVLAVPSDRTGPAIVVTDGSPRQDGVDYHYSFSQVTRPSIYALFGSDPDTAGDGVDPFLASVATYRVADLDTGSNESDIGVDMVRISPTTADGRYVAGTEVWLGWNPENGEWELWDDPRRHYPGPPTDVLDSTDHTAPEHWDATHERHAINTHDSPGIPEPDIDHAILDTANQPDPWTPDPTDPLTAPELEL